MATPLTSYNTEKGTITKNYISVGLRSVKLSNNDTDNIKIYDDGSHLEIIMEIDDSINTLNVSKDMFNLIATMVEELDHS